MRIFAAVYLFVKLDTAPQEQQDLFIKKLLQCCNVFNFLDPLMEVKSKEIKRACLNELVDYMMSVRGVLTEPVYPEIVKMVPDFIYCRPPASHLLVKVYIACGTCERYSELIL